MSGCPQLKWLFHQVYVQCRTKQNCEHFFSPSRRAQRNLKIDFFQQDSDPKHTAKINQQYLVNKGYKILPWVSQSPDLNPIENLWSIIEDMMKDRKPQNEDQLFQCIQTAWDNVPTDLLQRLADSMPRRCAAVIKSKGLATILKRKKMFTTV